MTARPSLRTHDLALTGHISVQQVRNYEANGLIPKAQRSPSGYRLYTQQHLAALKVYSCAFWLLTMISLRNPWAIRAHISCETATKTVVIASAHSKL